MASAGWRWTPESWKAELKDKVESSLLSTALSEAMKEYSEQFKDLSKTLPQAKAMPKLNLLRLLNITSTVFTKML